MKLWHRWAIGLVVSLALGASWLLDDAYPDTENLVAQDVSDAIQQARVAAKEK